MYLNKKYIRFFSKVYKYKIVFCILNTAHPCIRKRSLSVNHIAYLKCLIIGRVIDGTSLNSLLTLNNKNDT